MLYKVSSKNWKQLNDILSIFSNSIIILSGIKLDYSYLKAKRLFVLDLLLYEEAITNEDILSGASVYAKAFLEF